MKKTFLMIFAFFVCISHSFTQTVETIRVKGIDAPDFIAKASYKFPAYTKAKIYFKNGDLASGKLNFDYFNQEMKYIGEKGDTLAIANIAEVKYIVFPVDTFFYDNGYLEWAATSGKGRIAFRTEYKLSDKQLVGAFGTTSTGSKIDAFDAFRDATNTAKLVPDQEYVFTKQKTYYIAEINGNFVEVNKRNLSRLFPKKDIDSYIKDNKLNLNKEQDLIDVFVYASKPK